MKYSMDRTQVREMLRVMDISHTLNGGVAEPRISEHRFIDHLEYRIKAPGVAVEDLHVRLVDQHVVISHDVTIQERTLPRILTSIALDITMEYEGIYAEADENELVVKIPLNDLNRGLRKEIPITR